MFGGSQSLRSASDEAFGRLSRSLSRPERVAAARAVAALSSAQSTLLASCHPKQLAFVTDPHRRVAGLVGRGGGKTTGGRVRMVLRALRTSRARCLYLATTRGQAEELMWFPLKDLCHRLGLEVHFNDTKLRATFRATGATLRLVGIDDKHEIEKLRGQPFHEVHIDEAATHAIAIVSHVLERIIGPRLGDFGGVLVMYGTPGHILDGPFYEATRPGSPTGRAYEDRDKHENWLGWSTHHWTLLDGAEHVPVMARLWAEALREKAANSWSDDNPIWRREYLGIWAADDTEAVFRYRPFLDDGTPWNQWDPERDPATGFAKLAKGDWSYTYGLDMGHADPFALVVLAHRATSRELLHVYEFERTGMYARSIAELLVGKAWVERVLAGLEPGEPGGIVGITGWPDGVVADIASLGGAVLDELREVYGLTIKAADKKHKHDSIELTNGHLVDGLLKILKGSALEQQLLHLQWAQDSFGQIKEARNQPNDLTDALIYARRDAMHLIAEQPAPSAPERGSREAVQAWMDASEDKAATTDRADDLAPASYEEQWDAW